MGSVPRRCSGNGVPLPAPQHLSKKMGSRGWKPTSPPAPGRGRGTAFLEQTRALFIYLSIHPATHLFILNSNVFSSGRHKEGKKVKLIRGPFQVGSQPPAASGERLLSDLLPECGCPGASAEHLLRCSPYQAGHLRPLPHQGKAAHCFKVTTALCNWKHACFAKYQFSSLFNWSVWAGQLAEFLGRNALECRMPRFESWVWH